MDIYLRQQTGKNAEREALQFLQAKGLKLLTKNYRCYYGEIDLIMQDKQDIVFVEVRSRSSRDFGSALESVNYQKMDKLIKAATHFLQKKCWLQKYYCRFDVIGIQYEASKTQLEWVKNAFSVENSL